MEKQVGVKLSPRMRVKGHIIPFPLQAQILSSHLNGVSKDELIGWVLMLTCSRVPIAERIVESVIATGIRNV